MEVRVEKYTIGLFETSVNLAKKKMGHLSMNSNNLNLHNTCYTLHSYDRRLHLRPPLKTCCSCTTITGLFFQYRSNNGESASPKRKVLYHSFISLVFQETCHGVLYCLHNSKSSSNVIP